MRPLEQRPHYQPDGGIKLLGLPLLLVGTFATALGLAWLFKTLYVLGWYLIIMGPLLGAFLIGGVVTGLVALTHCRNRWLAAGVGALAGGVAFLGHYYLCMLDLLPPGNFLRFEFLPDYVLFRMNTDMAVDVGRGAGNQPKEPFAGLNWYAFVFELGGMVVIPAVMGWLRASRAYNRELGLWLHKETVPAAPYVASQLADAVARSELTTFLAAPNSQGTPPLGCQVVLEYVHRPTTPMLSQPIYLSVSAVPSPKPWYWPRTLPRTYVRQVQLTSAEATHLRGLFPEFARCVESEQPELEKSQPPFLAAQELPTDEVATLESVPEPYRQRVRTSGYGVKVNLVALMPVVYLAAGLGLGGFGVYLVSDGQRAASIPFFVVGVASAFWGCYVAMFCLCVYENRWIDRKLRSMIRERPSTLVDPDEPESVYVSIIPREHFSKIQLTMSSDVLLMGIDAKRLELLLEGDSDRYRIPMGSIAACEPQCFFHAIDAQRQNELWMVRMLVRFSDGMRELLLSLPHTSFRIQTNTTRRVVAEKTCAAIASLRDTR